MSADTLRRAAALMRERAEAATPGPWEARTGGSWPWAALYVDEATIPDGESLPSIESGGSATHADIQHIASWHPAVALAVADWLAVVARRWPSGRSSVTRERAHALAVARAYLGEQS